MNNIFTHIEYLLIHKECVIVPGFGAFISALLPARIDMQSRRLIPPCRSLMFNQSVSSDDGLLAHSYARKLEIPFEDARQLVVRDVFSLKESLFSHGELQCGKLGRIMLGEEDNLVFFPTLDNGSYAELMGYSDIAVPSAEMSVTRDIISIDSEKSDSDVEASHDSTVATLKEDDGKPDYYSLKISKTFIRMAAVLGLIISVAITVTLNPIPRDTREQRASVVPVEAIIKTTGHRQNDSVENSYEVKEIVPHTPKHYLIVATFSSKKEAETYAEAYSTPDFPMTTVSSSKMTRVAIASSDDKDSLRVKLNSGVISREYPQAWIWSRN